MLNLKDLFGLLAAVSVLFVVLGLVRFGVDVWNYVHSLSASTAGTPSAGFSYRGLGGVGAGLGLFCIFMLLHRWSKY